MEDDADSLALLELALTGSGASVTAAVTASQALAALESQRFDLMISDLGLPDTDGFDLIAAARGTLKLSADVLPAVALSGYAAHEDRERSLAVGYQLHLAKPVDLGTFTAVLSSLLSEK